jgi:hypothetical protein
VETNRAGGILLSGDVQHELTPGTPFFAAWADDR